MSERFLPLVLAQCSSLGVHNRADDVFLSVLLVSLRVLRPFQRVWQPFQQERRRCSETKNLSEATSTKKRRFGRRLKRRIRASWGPILQIRAPFWPDERTAHGKGNLAAAMGRLDGVGDALREVRI
ncbi:TPA: hypothetical protein BOS_8674 [Bos taurus]|nr:TPA: hypothetical protein BOS_8674 [Bos taurus]